MECYVTLQIGVEEIKSSGTETSLLLNVVDSIHSGSRP